MLCVDPAKRYTIDEFLAHPWITEPASSTVTPVAAPAAPAPALPPSVFQTPLDSPLLQAAHGFGFREGRSPGINTLKEAFDITYAVHRMEEEGAMRRNVPGGGARGFRKGLNPVDEDFEEDVAGMNVKYGPEMAKAFEAEAGRRNRERQQQQPQRAGGASQHLARVLYDGRAGTRDQASSPGSSGRKKGPTEFDLDLHGATLLGRRHNRRGGAGPGGVEPSPLRQQAAAAGAAVSNPQTIRNEDKKDESSMDLD